MSTTHAADPPTGADLGRNATLFHRNYGALDRVSGPQKQDGARFYASELGTAHGRVLVEYPTDADLADAWEHTLFESPGHADRALGGDEA